MSRLTWQERKCLWGFHNPYTLELVARWAVPADNQDGYTDNKTWECQECGSHFTAYGETDPMSLH